MSWPRRRNLWRCQHSGAGTAPAGSSDLLEETDA
eukprot:CAMPEP_0203862910 /NCGR_PEP_ID=MMETSP0359-20131031/13862_1 /ASSEMBLY_ACC=CAM_ASM_000338 /TAXON_ID=268821 /ORGANISM="Scrippsiella Hangoei, Strain SHTV-5" /LENGTH=33 /DNA_ID= /DNA_START= /DNA_END= /DNA_ORIENTATION=